MKRFLVSLLFVLVFMLNSSVVMAETVVFNTSTKKIHSIGCAWAKKCTVNCIKIERKEAVKKGGVPCKVCGGK